MKINFYKQVCPNDCLVIQYAKEGGMLVCITYSPLTCGGIHLFGKGQSTTGVCLFLCYSAYFNLGMILVQCPILLIKNLSRAKIKAFSSNIGSGGSMVND